MPFRFLHLADLHLETHFGGRKEAKDRLRHATHQAFERAVDFATERRLHAVLVAGDAFDDPLLSLKTELFFRGQVERLARAGVWFLYVSGNHDPGDDGRRAAAIGFEAQPGTEDWRRRVHVFRKRTPSVVVVEDETGSPVGAVVGAGHPTEREDSNLAAEFKKQRSELPVVGLLHTQVESARAASEHERYAPSTPADYERLDYDYFALGHVHLRQQAVPGLPVWYAGNLQGRHAREIGPKGGLLVEATRGEHADPTFVAFAPVRWELVNLRGLAETGTIADLTELLAARIEVMQAESSEELAVRLELEGASPLAHHLKSEVERTDLELELLARTGAVEVQIRTSRLEPPRDVSALRAAPSVLGAAAGIIERAGVDDELLARLAPAELAGLAHLQGREDWSELTPKEQHQARLDYARTLLEGLEVELFDRCLTETGE